jgi:hypothetical protein
MPRLRRSATIFPVADIDAACAYCARFGMPI